MRHVIYLGIILTLLASCEKDDDTPSCSTPENSYSPTLYPLAIGNYWAYEVYDVDTAGNRTKRKYTDFTAINRDTIINGKKYFVLEGKYLGGQWRAYNYVRDSIGYIVSSSGNVLFAQVNFSDSVDVYTYEYGGTNWYTISRQLQDSVETIEVPAGKFKALNYKGSLITVRDSTPRYLDAYYSLNVGLIKETLSYVASNNKIERVLVSYDTDH